MKGEGRAGGGEVEKKKEVEGSGPQGRAKNFLSLPRPHHHVLHSLSLFFGKQIAARDHHSQALSFRPPLKKACSLPCALPLLHQPALSFGLLLLLLLLLVVLFGARSPFLVKVGSFSFELRVVSE